MANWLGTWSKRKKIEIDNTNIDSDLSHFPISIFLGSSSGINGEDTTEVFDQVGSDWQKIAITNNTGDSEIYVEKELWDDVNEKAVLWASASGLTLTSGSKTELYLYYDSSQSNNTSYVADVGSRNEVWDSDYNMVLHLRESGDGTADEFVDSTSNNNHGQGGGGNSSYTPTQIDGKIGKSQDFDGSNDYIKIPNDTSLNPDDITISFWINPDS
jgi:PHD/YefM family antitoxin component YafN of YafNO toxin-antitoxin module